MALVDKPGIYRDITPAQYFAGITPTASLSNSGMTWLLGETAAEFAYNHPMLNPEPQEVIAQTLEKRMGDVVHQVFLDKGRGYRVEPGDGFAKWDRRNKDVDAFLTGCERDGVTPVKRKEWEPIQKMAGVLRDRVEFALAAIAHKRGIPIPPGGIPYETEVVLVWQEDTPTGPVWCTGMVDVWCEMLLVAFDAKLTKRMSNRWVRAHMQNMSWDRQGVFYERGLNKLIPEAAGRVTFADVMVKPEAPYVHRMVNIDKAWRSGATIEIERALAMFGECLTAGRWPGYPDDIESLDAPPWHLKNLMDMAGEDGSLDA